MRSMFVALAGLLVAGMWSTPAQAQAPQPLKDFIVGWEAAFNEGDAEALAALYTEDAVRMPPRQEIQSGRAEIAADVANYAGISIRLETTGGMMDENVATSWGTYELSGTTADGQTVAVSGRWMNGLKNTDDGWKIYRDIWHEGPGGS